MRRLGGMLLIGSGGANAGKTELASELLRRFGVENDIIGIKITTIKEKDGRCPRGGEGCGVCSSIRGSFEITREENCETDKDTSRLLAAGAKDVYWVRVLKEHLKEAVGALLDVIGEEAVTICESNSLREVVEPGVFLLVRRDKQRQMKDSAKAVAGFADAIVVSHPNGFDFDLGRIKLVEGRWFLEK
jgi:hypothetical protein